MGSGRKLRVSGLLTMLLVHGYGSDRYRTDTNSIALTLLWPVGRCRLAESICQCTPLL